MSLILVGGLEPHFMSQCKPSVVSKTASREESLLLSCVCKMHSFFPIDAVDMSYGFATFVMLCCLAHKYSITSCVCYRSLYVVCARGTTWWVKSSYPMSSVSRRLALVSRVGNLSLPEVECMWVYCGITICCSMVIAYNKVLLFAITVVLCMFHCFPNAQGVVSII